MNTSEITSEQIENFLKNDQMSEIIELIKDLANGCLLYTSPSPRDRTRSRMPSSA